MKIKKHLVNTQLSANNKTGPEIVSPNCEMSDLIVLLSLVGKIKQLNCELTLNN